MVEIFQTPRRIAGRCTCYFKSIRWIITYSSFAASTLIKRNEAFHVHNTKLYWFSAKLRLQKTFSWTLYNIASPRFSMGLPLSEAWFGFAYFWCWSFAFCDEWSPEHSQMYQTVSRKWRERIFLNRSSIFWFLIWIYHRHKLNFLFPE